jgi:hypothetical protein
VQAVIKGRAYPVPCPDPGCGNPMGAAECELLLAESPADVARYRQVQESQGCCSRLRWPAMASAVPLGKTLGRCVLQPLLNPDSQGWWPLQCWKASRGAPACRHHPGPAALSAVLLLTAAVRAGASARQPKTAHLQGARSSQFTQASRWLWMSFCC